MVEYKGMMGRLQPNNKKILDAIGIYRPGICGEFEVKDKENSKKEGGTAKFKKETGQDTMETLSHQCLLRHY
jgi:hypothetical protein